MSAVSRRNVLAGIGAAAALPWRAIAQAPPSIPPASLDETLEVEGEGLAARLAQSRMSVGVMVNGQGPFRFTVDGGADRSVIGSRLAAALALPEGPRVVLHSTTGRAEVGTVRIDRLTIGDSEIRDIAAPALPEAFIGAQGLLGIDALADQRLMLDFDRRRIVVQDTRRRQAAPLEEGEIVVTARRRNGQLILTQAAAGRVPLYAIIDSGSEVTVGNLPLRARLFGRGTPPVVAPVDIVSVTGETVRADTLTLPLLRLGGITLQSVPVAFFDAPPFRLFGLGDQPALLLGTDVLSAFARVSLDFRARRVRFRLR